MSFFLRWRLRLGIGFVLLSAMLYLYLGRTGWEADTIGAANYWCEFPRAGLVREPTNSLTSLAYVAVGLYLLKSMSAHNQPEDNPLRHASYANAVYVSAAVLIGIGSFAMHGSNTRLGIYADTSAMMLFFSFPALYTFARLRGWSDARFGIAAVIVNTLLIASQTIYMGDGIRTLMLGIWIALEVVLRYRERLFLIFLVPACCDTLLSPFDNELFLRISLYAVLAIFFSRMECHSFERTAKPWGLLGIFSYLLAYSAWRLGTYGESTCYPDSLLQGHAVWHLLSAFSMLSFYWYFSTETSAALEAE